MTRPLFVHFLPDLVSPEALTGGQAVVIDLLRASTTICHAFDAGVEIVIPFEDIEEARNASVNYPAGTALLGGERGGEIIPGFDLDNSPFSYTAETVTGKTILFTTTNGTRALKRATAAERVFVGAFANLNATVDVLLKTGGAIHLICAGTNGQITSEDILCAGAIAIGCFSADDSIQPANDPAQIAACFYESHSQNQEVFLSALKNSLGGRNLQALGFEHDILQAAKWDLFNFVPEFHADTGQIQVSDNSNPMDKLWIQPPGEMKSQ